MLCWCNVDQIGPLHIVGPADVAVGANVVAFELGLQDALGRVPIACLWKSDLHRLAVRSHGKDDEAVTESRPDSRSLNGLGHGCELPES